MLTYEQFCVEYGYTYDSDISHIDYQEYVENHIPSSDYEDDSDNDETDESD